MAGRKRRPKVGLVHPVQSIHSLLVMPCFSSGKEGIHSLASRHGVLPDIAAAALLQVPDVAAIVFSSPPQQPQTSR